MITPGSDDANSFADSCMTAVIKATIDKTVSGILTSVNFNILLRQKIEDTVSPAQFVVKITKTLLETNELLKLVAHVFKAEADGVL